MNSLVWLDGDGVAASVVIVVVVVMQIDGDCVKDAEGGTDGEKGVFIVMVVCEWPGEVTQCDGDCVKDAGDTDGDKVLILLAKVRVVSLHGV